MLGEVWAYPVAAAAVLAIVAVAIAYRLRRPVRLDVTVRLSDARTQDTQAISSRRNSADELDELEPSTRGDRRDAADALDIGGPE